MMWIVVRIVFIVQLLSHAQLFATPWTAAAQQASLSFTISLKSLLQHHSSKASVLQSSRFFMVQLSNPYMTTGKNHCFE